ncbi:hypothetical protein BC939DRAFT_512736 [Gamsiella multidivaricata]|uniref:uncharacterized protein n=1 Tax=Gamsiella multidivaricata TaxID=101098 RepID=UPI00221EE627|nr:uncharacterized protein BC939DRAFT_512736 [Gamsiella multidivaricata]KAI7828026.1 hypothetical protein BC939DRAFT_512736 [Gamsiella multidivaricata]
MNQLTIDYARFTRSRDDFITYDDVYNLLYALTAKQMRKDDDPLISARLWMEDLENQNYFTYYDREHGLYHRFSSPWQLDELRKWGIFSVLTGLTMLVERAAPKCGGSACFDKGHMSCATPLLQLYLPMAVVTSMHGNVE